MTGRYLTAQEVVWLLLIGEGLPVDAVARVTYSSGDTIRWHIKRMLRRWDVPRTSTLLRDAYLAGCLP